jgi:hypothetical protein
MIQMEVTSALISTGKGCKTWHPVVEEQLTKMALAGKWKNKPLPVDLGTLLLDNSTI